MQTFQSLLQLMSEEGQQNSYDPRYRQQRHQQQAQVPQSQMPQQGQSTQPYVPQGQQGQPNGYSETLPIVGDKTIGPQQQGQQGQQNYDNSHALDSDEALQKVAQRLSDTSSQPLKNKHVRRMLDLIRKNPKMSADQALAVAVNEAIKHLKPLLWRRLQ